MFIKLTFPEGTFFYIRPESIQEFGEIFAGEFKGKNYIKYSGCENNLVVKESIEEIISRINEVSNP